MFPDDSHAIEFFHHLRRKGCLVRTEICGSGAFGIGFANIEHKDWSSRAVIVVAHPVAVLIGADRQVAMVDWKLYSSQYVKMNTLDNSHTVAHSVVTL